MSDGFPGQLGDFGRDSPSSVDQFCVSATQNNSRRKPFSITRQRQTAFFLMLIHTWAVHLSSLFGRFPPSPEAETGGPCVCPEPRLLSASPAGPTCPPSALRQRRITVEESAGDRTNLAHPDNFLLSHRWQRPNAGGRCGSAPAPRSSPKSASRDSAAPASAHAACTTPASHWAGSGSWCSGPGSR